MGLLRFLRGKRKSLNDVVVKDGNVYVCTDDGTVHFDYVDDDGNVQRQQVNARDAESIAGAVLSTSLNPSDQEIPTSNAIIQQGYAKVEDVPTKVSQLENDTKFISEEYVDAYFKRLNSDNVLRFYCIEEVTVVTNGVSTVYPANSNVEVKFLGTDVWEIIPTSENSIMALNAFPGALGTYYPWLEGVKQFSNILFDMNNEDMYSKWSQGNQGSYKVQYAQYLNCIFWSDNPYISEVTKRTNYTLYYTSQLPLCYSTIPDNTFKAFYLAFNVNSDPNWGNKAYRDSFAKATWATQVFSYYGARTIGIFGHDHSDFNITLPKDCRGLMCEATAIENAGTFDAINVTNFGAKQGSWRDAFRMCYSLRNLYIKNLTVNLNISWSPINYDSIYFIISSAANTNSITISVSPYTYNLLNSADFELAASKNITIELLTTNLIEDRRLTAITLNGDGTKVLGDDGVYKTLPAKISQLENDSNFKEKDLIVSRASSGSTTTTHSVSEIADAVEAGRTVRFLENVELFNLLEVNKDYGYATFFMLYVNQQEKLQSQVITIIGNEIYDDIDNTYDYALKADVPTNLKNGSAAGSLRGISTLAEDASYTMGVNAFAIGNGTKASGKNSFASGQDVEATGSYAHAEGYSTFATAAAAHAEGYDTHATARYAHAEGASTTASGNNSHAEGNSTTSSGHYSHAEGNFTTAAGAYSHAEGNYAQTTDNGTYSHVEGSYTKATKTGAHAEGNYTEANGAFAHTEGYYTKASSPYQHVRGKYNVVDEAGVYSTIVGNGDAENNRKNIHTLDWSGNAWFSGEVRIGGTNYSEATTLCSQADAQEIAEDVVTWGTF